MRVVIRKYHSDDVLKVVRLLQRCGQRMTEDEFDRMLDEPGERIRENTFVAVLGDTIVGCIRLCFVQTDEPGHIRVFSFGEVDPEQRRKGIGTLLYQHAIRHLHQMAEQEDCRFTLRQTVDAENVDQRKVLERTGFMLTSSLSTMRLTEARLSKTHLTQDGDSLLTSDDGFHIRPTTQEDAADCARLYNAAFSWRTNAIPLYRSIGFEAYKEWLGYSLTIGPRDDGKLRDGDKSSRKD
jgi:mycothiol synthase